MTKRRAVVICGTILAVALLSKAACAEPAVEWRVCSGILRTAKDAKGTNSEASVIGRGRDSCYFLTDSPVGRAVLSNCKINSSCRIQARVIPQSRGMSPILEARASDASQIDETFLQGQWVDDPVQCKAGKPTGEIWFIGRWATESSGKVTEGVGPLHLAINEFGCVLSKPARISADKIGFLASCSEEGGKTQTRRASFQPITGGIRISLSGGLPTLPKRESADLYSCQASNRSKQAAGPIATESDQQRLLQYNGSTFYVRSTADKIAIYVDRPNPELQKLNVPHGVMLLNGEINGDQIIGSAFAFIDPKCGPTSFIAQGRLSGDKTSIQLRGLVPQTLAPDCHVLVTKEETWDLAPVQNSRSTWSPDITIPNTNWIYSAQTVAAKVHQCEIELLLPSGTRKRTVKFAILAKGTPVLALMDEYIERPVRDTLGWSSGKTFSVALNTDRGPIKTDAEVLDEEYLLVHLPKDQPLLLQAIYGTKRLSVSVEGIAFKSYDLPGLTLAIDYLDKCPIPH